MDSQVRGLTRKAAASSFACGNLTKLVPGVIVIVIVNPHVCTRGNEKLRCLMDSQSYQSVSCHDAVRVQHFNSLGFAAAMHIHKVVLSASSSAATPREGCIVVIGS